MELYIQSKAYLRIYKRRNAFHSPSNQNHSTFPFPPYYPLFCIPLCFVSSLHDAVIRVHLKIIFTLFSLSPLLLSLSLSFTQLCLSCRLQIHISLYVQISDCS